MAILFVVEDGSGKPDATSYVSVAEADDISDLNIHTHAAWDALTPEQKENLLMYASKILDTRAKWHGARATTTQALDWPRSGMVDESKNALSASAIPYNLKFAVVELAKWSAGNDKLATERPDNVIGEVKVDSINVRFASPTTVAYEAYKIPSLVANLLRPFGKIKRDDSAQPVTFGRVLV